MSTQIFKSKIPNDILFQLLKDIAVKSSSAGASTGAKDDVYIVNNNVYKKGIFNGKIAAFYEVCKPYYHLSKRKYLEKKYHTIHLLLLLDKYVIQIRLHIHLKLNMINQFMTSFIASQFL